MTLAIGVDIGGTKIAAGLVSDTGTIVESVSEPTPDDATKIPAIVADLVERLAGDERPVGVGIGAAGFVGEDRATVRFAPNIDWREEPLAAHVRALVDLPIVVENDANAAAWGEFRFGAGEDTDDLLLITIGTGIGGGIVHHGQLFRGGFGVAAEIGHMRVVPDGILCGCGQRGCYEQYGSGSALVRDARERVSNGDPRAASIAALADGDLSRITGPAVTKLAQDGDPLAVELLTELGRWIGEGAAVLAAILDPSVIAIGGGVAAAGDLLLEPVVAAFETHLPARAHRPEAALRLAALGNEAGIIGAADLARVEPA
ncbi:ROK family glucokinase [Aeromicrobium sp. S22]|uniref:ROK family glucokinase n=1 Tax=Aeromicrobium sp. S22 TaxID=2662029 RepID=UPI0013C1849B|nr:ROK family glucokinase [Aeromicrobium sp. S22]MRK02188.1 ROK family glucokinase [Aeromicrobium sp. S22]